MAKEINMLVNPYMLATLIHTHEAAVDRYARLRLISLIKKNWNLIEELPVELSLLKSGEFLSLYLIHRREKSPPISLSVKVGDRFLEYMIFETVLVHRVPHYTECVRTENLYDENFESASAKFRDTIAEFSRIINVPTINSFGTSITKG